MSGKIPDPDHDNRRKLKRKYMLFKIPAYDAQTRRFLGLVQDLTEQGIQLFGVKVEIATRKSLIIQASDYIKSDPLYFEAQCRWSRQESPHGYYVSGFEIVQITDNCRDNLAKLMQFVTLG
ncbi:hypothetical protein ACFL2Q_01235 [Thermodesulfobacteriota bacterium]